MPTVLVVEDEPAIRALIQAIVAGEPWHLLEAPNGKAALDLLGEGPVDAIVLDINMPIMGGVEFARVYHQTPGPHAPILVCSTEDSVRPEAIGAAAFVRKPFGPSALLPALRELVVTECVMDQALAS